LAIADTPFQERGSAPPLWTFGGRGRVQEDEMKDEMKEENPEILLNLLEGRVHEDKGYF